MTVADLGTMTLGAAIPAGLSLVAAVELSVGIAAPDITAQLALAVGFEAQASLDMNAQIDIALAIIAQLEAAITLGITAPSLSLQASIAVDVSADLSLKLGTLNAQLSLALGLGLLFAEAGVRVLTFDGAQNDFGAELTTELGGDTSQAWAVVLLTQASAAWTAMQGVLTAS